MYSSMASVVLASSVCFAAAAGRGAARSGCRNETVPTGFCAIIYGGKDCRGWKFEVLEGFTRLPVWAQDEASSVLTGPRCHFYGFDDEDHGEGSLSFIGRMWRKEKIKAVACLCHIPSLENYVEHPQRPMIMDIDDLY